MYLKDKNNGNKRWSIFPILHNDLWDRYKKVASQYWVAEEVDLSTDNFDTELNENEKHYLKNLLAFFAVSDGLVLENLNSDFTSDVDLLEALYFYQFQACIEGVHGETYALLIETYIKNEEEKSRMYDAISKIETVSKKASWTMKYLDSNSFAERLVAFSLCEGLSFSSTFAGIFYFRSRQKMKGLCGANELILRDEISHYEFAVHLYHNYLKDEYKLDKEVIKQMVLECTQVEETFVDESMPEGLVGITKEDIKNYVKYVADIILKDYGIEPHFKVTNTLEYMEKIGLQSKNNFFENRVGSYTRLEIPNSEDEMFDDDF